MRTLAAEEAKGAPVEAGLPAIFTILFLFFSFEVSVAARQDFGSGLPLCLKGRQYGDGQSASPFPLMLCLIRDIVLCSLLVALLCLFHLHIGGLECQVEQGRTLH